MTDAAALVASPRRRNRKPVCRRRSGPRLSGSSRAAGWQHGCSTPTEIRLFFIEAIEPRFSGIEMATIDGRPVKTGPAVVEPRDAMQYVLPVPPLHSVRW